MRCYKLRLNLDFLMGSSLAFLQSHETPGYPNMGVIELWNLLDSVSQHTLHRILCLRLCISEEWRNSVFTMGSKPFFWVDFDSYAFGLGSHFLIFWSEIELIIRNYYVDNQVCIKFGVISYKLDCPGAKALTKYEQPKMKRDARQKCSLSLFSVLRLVCISLNRWMTANSTAITKIFLTPLGHLARGICVYCLDTA